MLGRRAVPEGPDKTVATPDVAATASAARQGSWPRWLAFATGVLICSYFLFRQAPVPDLFANSDKFGHAGAFCALVILGYLAAARVSARFVVLLIGILALATASEWVQHTALLPHRHGDVTDLIADVGGWALGLTVVLLLDQRQRWVMAPTAERR